jgi:ABC-2 type transport system ATP-binding protein
VISFRRNGEVVTLDTETPTRTLLPLLLEARERGEELKDLTVTRPSLEDVYLQLTREGDG